MGDLGYLLTFVAAVGALTAGITWWLVTKMPRLSRRRIVAIAPLPLPALLSLLCLYVAIDAASASAEECGVDACGMAIGAAVFGMTAAIVVYFLGMVVAEGTLRLINSEGRNNGQ